MAHHRIHRGLDLPIAGVAEGGIVDLPPPATVSYDPRELRGVVPRLKAREGDVVKQGQPVLFHKFDPRVQLVSPVSGTVKEVRRGARRVITDLVIEAGEGEAVQHRAWSLDELKGISRDDAVAQMCEGGVWPFLRTRPLDHVAMPDTTPQSIVIVGTDSGPLQPGAEVLLDAADGEALQAAVFALKALTDGAVHVTTGEQAPAVLSGLQGVETHGFSGPHPSGDPAVQVSHVSPPAHGRQVFYVRAWDAVTIGRLFLTGRFDPTRVYAAVGVSVKQPRFVRTVLGAPVADIVGEVTDGPQRWIRGSVLTGQRVDAEGWSGLYTRAVHVLPDEVEVDLFGWAMPQLSRWSFHKAFLKGFGSAAKRFDLRPGLFGGHRAIVPTGIHSKVIATPDIEPVFLFRTMIAGDLEGSIELGLLDISEEEAALLSYICPSKIDYDVILRESLELYAKEA